MTTNSDIQLLQKMIGNLTVLNYNDPNPVGVILWEQRMEPSASLQLISIERLQAFGFSCNLCAGGFGVVFRYNLLKNEMIKPCVELSFFWLDFVD